MKSISVVVPVYNVEKYLGACIQSILDQTYTDFELILVDDGATDTSGTICDDYAEKDSRIIVIHKKNGGLSDARNAGIQQASGKYMIFVDSDDYIENNTLQDVFMLAEQHQADLVIFGYYADVFNKNGTIESHKNNGNDSILEDHISIAKAIVPLKRNFVFDTCCNKLYLTDVIKKNDLKMPVGEIFEDTAFNTNLLPYINKMIITSNCYYHYAQRNAARITNTYNPNKFIILKKRYLLLLAYLNQYCADDSKEIRQANFIYIKYVFSCMIDLFKNGAKLHLLYRRKVIKDYLKDQELQKALLNIQGYSRIDNIIIWFLKTNNITLLYLFACFLYELKYRYKRLFFRIKQNMMKSDGVDR